MRHLIHPRVNVDLKNCAVIVLSAGRGSRVGCSKGLVEVKGRAWILWLLEELALLETRQINVVLGFDAEKYPPLKSARIVLNKEPELGPFSSLQSGLRELDLAQIEGAFVMPVDMPCPSAELFEKLYSEATSPYLASFPQCRGKGGHPIFLKSKFIAILLDLDPKDPSSRLDVQCRALGNAILHVVCQEEAVLMNFNVLDDFRL